jgi:predicted O-linked N-acetylglucosamine transferase (SPINDLY family)
MLTNLGLTELIARTPEECVATAKRMAGDLKRLAEMRAGMRERMKSSPLTDSRGFAAGIESAYRAMWKEWVSSD